MTFTSATLLYLLVSRALITAAGIAGMWFGYRLFLQPRNSEASLGGSERSTDPKGATIETSVLGVQFRIKNAAPGIAFSLFGAVLIIVMLIQSSPSVSIETIRKAQDGSKSTTTQEDATTEKIVMRGDGQTTIPNLTVRGKELEARGDVAGAELAYKEAVTSVAEPINDLAWIYLQSGRKKESLELATLAVQMRSDEPRYVDTFQKSRNAQEGHHTH